MVADYNGNDVFDSIIINNSAENFCLGDCLCEENPTECVPPQPDLKCILGECDAQCDSDDDCGPTECSEQFDDYCVDLKMVDYNGNDVFDFITVTDSVENACLGDCLCEENQPECLAPPADPECVLGECGAECVVDADCDDQNIYTTDICLNSCACSYDDLPHCGDGIVNLPEEECDGTDGVPAGFICLDNCTLYDIPVCENLTYYDPVFWDNMTWLDTASQIAILNISGEDVCANLSNTFFQNHWFEVDDFYCQNRANCDTFTTNDYTDPSWITYDGPFPPGNESCHVIEHFSTDIT